MEYTDWLWIKFGVLVVLAGIWGFWRGITGQPLELESNDTPQGQAGSQDY